MSNIYSKSKTILDRTFYMVLNYILCGIFMYCIQKHTWPSDTESHMDRFMTTNLSINYWFMLLSRYWCSLSVHIKVELKIWSGLYIHICQSKMLPTPLPHKTKQNVKYWRKTWILSSVKLHHFDELYCVSDPKM